MDGFLAGTVYLTAIVYAKFHDPLAWCMIVIIAIMSTQRHPLWRVLIVIFGFAAANVALVYRWWIESGLGFHPWRIWNILFAMTVIAWQRTALADYWRGPCLGLHEIVPERISTNVAARDQILPQILLPRFLRANSA